MDNKRRRVEDLETEIARAQKTTGTATIAALLKAAGCSDASWRRVNENTSKYQKFLDAIEVELDGGGGNRSYKVPVIKPQELLNELLATSRKAQRAYGEALAATPPTYARPWRVVVAYDEYAPGAQLTGRHPLKTMHLAFTFLELGMQQHGDLWLSGLCSLARRLYAAFVRIHMQARVETAVARFAHLRLKRKTVCCLAAVACALAFA